MSRYLDKFSTASFDSSAWISQAEAAKLRGVSRQAISELVKRGRITTVVIGKRKLLKRSEIEDFQSQQPGPEPQKKRKK